uniref:hypothetical protein n=1 Tax=Nonomuraea sp. CA-252377 TaxID=3240003 RepID=UPI003F491FA8
MVAPYAVGYAYGAAGNRGEETVTEAGKTTSFSYRRRRRTPAAQDPHRRRPHIDDMELRLDYAKDTVEQTRYDTLTNPAVTVRTSDDRVCFLAGDHQSTGQAAVNTRHRRAGHPQPASSGRTKGECRGSARRSTT